MPYARVHDNDDAYRMHPSRASFSLAGWRVPPGSPHARPRSLDCTERRVSSRRVRFAQRSAAPAAAPTDLTSPPLAPVCSRRQKLSESDCSSHTGVTRTRSRGGITASAAVVPLVAASAAPCSPPSSCSERERRRAHSGLTRVSSSPHRSDTSCSPHASARQCVCGLPFRVCSSAVVPLGAASRVVRRPSASLRVLPPAPASRERHHRTGARRRSRRHRHSPSLVAWRPTRPVP